MKDVKRVHAWLMFFAATGFGMSCGSTPTSPSVRRLALRLYESLGFVYGPLPADPGYATTDIYMVLELN